MCGFPSTSPAAALSYNIQYGLGVAVAADGTLYASGFGSGLAGYIVRVSAGIAQRIAGSGGNSYIPSSGPALSFDLCMQSHLQVDTSGDLFVSAGCSGRLLRIPNGSTTAISVAGQGYGGMGISPQPGSSVYLQNTIGLAFDPVSEDIYIPIQDPYSGGSGVAFIDKSTERLQQLPGSGWMRPRAGAFDRAGNLYLADEVGPSIRQFPRLTPLTASATRSNTALSTRSPWQSVQQQHS